MGTQVKSIDDCRTAIIICCYNMPEYTDNLVEHIFKTVNMSFDLFVVDNGSDLVMPSNYTTYRIEKNIQMVPGFLEGLRLADETGKDYFAYWMITTSCRFDEKDSRDPLAELLPSLIAHENSFAIQPSLIIDYGAWKDYLAPRHPFTVRQVYALENVCPLYKAEPFNKLGRWRKELSFGWGISSELYWKARKENLRIFTHDGYVMYKDTFIGYKMDRMNMTGEERSRIASQQSKDVLAPIYGENWQEKLSHEYITSEMK